MSSITEVYVEKNIIVLPTVLWAADSDITDNIRLHYLVLFVVKPPEHNEKETKYPISP